MPGDADTGLSALAAAFTGGASNSATIVVRLDNSVDLERRAEEAERRPGAAPGASGWHDPGRPAEHDRQQLASASSSAAPNPTDVASSATSAVVAALKNHARPPQRQERPGGHRRPSSRSTSIRTRRSSTGPRRRASRTRSTTPWSGPRPGRSPWPAFRRTSTSSSTPSSTRSRPSGQMPVGAGACRSGRSPRSPAGYPGPDQPRRPVARLDDHGRHDQQGHRRRLRGDPEGDRHAPGRRASSAA